MCALQVGRHGLRDLWGPWSPGGATLGGGRLPEAPQPLTLCFLRQECLSRLFSPCGPVQSVQLQEKPDLTDSAEEPKSKFFHPTPVPVSVQVLPSAHLGAQAAARVALVGQSLPHVAEDAGQ